MAKTLSFFRHCLAGTIQTIWFSPDGLYHYLGIFRR